MKTANVVLLSGDVHCAEILHAKCSINQSPNLVSDLFELTSSGLSHTFTYLVVPDESGTKLDIKSRGAHFSLLYNFYQAILPARFREEHFADHFQGPHFAYLDIIEETVDDEATLPENYRITIDNRKDHLGSFYTRKLEIRYIDHKGQVVLDKSIPLVSKFPTRQEEPVLSESSFDCVPFWGEVSAVRSVVTRVVLAALLMVLIVIPCSSVAWFAGASGYYILYGAEQERRRMILERNKVSS